MFFVGLTGQVVLDNDAERVPDFAIWSFSPEQSTFEEAMLLHASYPQGKVCGKSSYTCMYLLACKCFWVHFFIYHNFVRGHP